jgi:hypothetical protein
MARRVAITTIDNPYDPIEDYQSWFNFDTRNGYNTSSYLARLVKSSEELGEAEYQRAVEDAIDEIIYENLLGLYKKVVVETSIPI